MNKTHSTGMIFAITLGVLGACGPPAQPPNVSDPPPTSPVAEGDPPPPVPVDGTTTTDAGPRERDESVRREMLESLLKPLWFGWYVAVHAGDPDALAATVALNRIHADGVDAIEQTSLGFHDTPDPDAYVFEVVDILRDDDDCIVVRLREDPRRFLDAAVVAERIGVFWPHDGRWYLATSWATDTPEFAWADDCELMVRTFA